MYFPTQHASGLQSSEISSPLWGYPEHPDDVVLRTFSAGAQMFWFATLVFSQDFFLTGAFNLPKKDPSKGAVGRSLLDKQ